jgi:flagellar protein FlaG
MKIPSLNTVPAETVIMNHAGVQARATSQDRVYKTREVPLQTNPPVQNDIHFANDAQKLDRKDVENEVNKLNEKIKFMNRSIKFSVDEKSNEIVVKVVDKTSGEVISQIPPEELLRLKERIDEMAGLLVEKTV